LLEQESVAEFFSRLKARKPTAAERRLHGDPLPGAEAAYSDGADHVVPFVYETLTSKALHFTIGEIQSRMRLDDPFALDLDYTRTMMGFLLFVPEPRRISMIGLGGGSLAKFCHRYVPAAHIDVVETNPHVVALRDEFHVPRDDRRFRVIVGDGARYVREHRGGCDILIVDGFDNEGQASELCTSRFYDDARDMLAADGMLVVNMHVDHRRHETYVTRIRAAFGQAVLAVDEADGGNQILFARKAAAFAPAPSRAFGDTPGLSKTAAKQLRSAFQRVRTAQQVQHP
jgi:spermidine synthase